MNHRITLSITMAICLLASMLCLPGSARAQQSRKLRADTGVVTLGTNQVLRITVNGQSGNDTILVQFAWTKYAPAGCNNDGVCRHTVQSQGVTTPVTINGAEAASFDMQGTGGDVRLSVRVKGTGVNGDEQLINTVTGETHSNVVIWFVEGDF